LSSACLFIDSEKLASFGLNPGVLEASVSKLATRTADSSPDPCFRAVHMCDSLRDGERQHV
jgi:hypothetical protein